MLARFYKLNALALLASLMFCPAQSRAEDADIIAVGWFDHLTYGAINTAIGIPLGLTGMVINEARSGEPSSIHFDETGQQLVFKNGSLNFPYEYSTGAIHHGIGEADAHEAAHGKQAGNLGPLFLPAVGLSYLLQGMDEGVMEEWAEEWKDLGKTMNNKRPLTLRFEMGSRDGKSLTKIGANFVMLERASRLNIQHAGKSFPTTVVYKYGEIGIHAPLSSLGEQTGTEDLCHCSRGTPLIIEGALLKKDFQAQWATMAKAIKILIDSKQETGALKIDFDYKRLDAKLLSHILGIGVRLGYKETMALDLIGRAGGNLKGVWSLGVGSKMKSDLGVTLTGQVEAEARFHLMDWAEVYGKIEREVGTSGYAREAEVVGATTPLLFSAQTFTGANGQDGTATRLYGGVEYRKEDESISAPTGGNGDPFSSEIKMTIFTLGGRF